MIALYDFVPKYCPYCGCPIRGLSRDPDYHAKASHSCPDCELHFQLTDTRELLLAAENSGGDLPKYAG